MKTTRNSSIELLRIIALSMVVFIHFFSEVKGLVNSTIYHTMLFTNSFCVCAVDLFLIISGYFLYKNNKRNTGKPLDLVFQVSFYNVFFLFLFVLLGLEVFQSRALIAAMVPASYFIILYVALYFISPYINYLFARIDDGGRKVLLAILLCLFSLYPTFVDLFGEVVNVEWWGLSTIGAWGGQQGFNIVNFTLCYLVGCALKEYEHVIRRWFEKSIKIVAVIFINTMLIIGWAELCEYLSLHGMRSAWVYHNPLVLANAALLFVLFSKMEFKSPVINTIAPCSLTLFLIHTKIIHQIPLNQIVTNGALTVVISFILMLLGLWLVSWILYWLYGHSIGRLFDGLREKKIPYDF